MLILHDLFYVLLQVLFYLWSLLKCCQCWDCGKTVSTLASGDVWTTPFPGRTWIRWVSDVHCNGQRRACEQRAIIEGATSITASLASQEQSVTHYRTPASIRYNRSPWLWHANSLIGINNGFPSAFSGRYDASRATEAAVDISRIYFP